MTLQDLRDHLAKQVLCFQACFTSGDDDPKTAKSYRKSIQEARDRLDIVEKILLDGYVPERHDSAADQNNHGD